MEALTAKAALVDPATLDDEGSAITTRIPRSEIEEAARAEGPSEFFLDVQRVRGGDPEQREVEAEQRITVSWDPDDLEKLLRSATTDEVTLAFKPEELARMFEEPDVEAQGLREKVAILTVAATTAAGISAGVASAQTAPVMGDAGGGTSAAFVTDATSSGPASSLQAQEQAFRVSEQSAAGASDLQAQEHAFRVSEESGTGGTNLVTDTTSSGPGATGEAAGTGGTSFVTDATSSGPGATEASGGTSFVTDATSSGPGATEASGGTSFVTDATSSGPGATGEAAGTGGTSFVTDATSSGPGASTEAASAAGGGGQSWFEGRGGEAALAGGLALLIVGAGFVGTRQRRGVQPA